MDTLTEHPDEDTLRIMVATDNHVGYAERDPVRGMDSFAALEEVFIRAQEYNVDMVLLGGDLFHENKPSRTTLHRVITILRKYCLNDKPVSFEILSEQKENFASSFGQVNYEDPNYSVGLPVFCIHGNHDDPTRDGSTDPLSALDLLSINNLINYFGTSPTTDNVEVNPIILRKGTTYVALYGLGNMRDERLNRMWHKKKVKFLRQMEGESDEPMFNLFVIHQNRDAGRGSKNCVQDSMIPQWMNMVIWGHEHQCIINPVESATNGFWVVQPGSSVATSLVDGEAVPKHIGIMEIKLENLQHIEVKARMVPIPLRNVRPFTLRELKLSELDPPLDKRDPRLESTITDILANTVKDMIEEARVENPEPIPFKGQMFRIQNFDKVLVRLKVEHTGFPTINSQRFGAQFSDQVANPGEILLFTKSRKAAEGGNRKTQTQTRGATQVELQETLYDDYGDKAGIKVEDLVRAEIQSADKKLQILNEPDFYIALDEYVNKSSTSAIADVVDSTLETTRRELKRYKGELDEDTIKLKASEVQEQQRLKAEDMLTKIEKRKESAAAKKKGGDDMEQDHEEHEDVNAKAKARRRDTASDEEDDIGFGDEDEDVSKASSKGKATSRGRASQAKKPAAKKFRAAAKPAARGRGKKSVPSDDDDDMDDDDEVEEPDDDDDDDEEEESMPPPKKRGGAIRKRPAAKKTDVISIDLDDEEEEDDVSEEVSEDDDPGPKRGRKPAAAAKATTARGRGRGRGGASQSSTSTAAHGKRTLPAMFAASSARSGGARGSQRGGASQSNKRARPRHDEEEEEDRARAPKRSHKEQEDDDFDEDAMSATI